MGSGPIRAPDGVHGGVLLPLQGVWTLRTTTWALQPRQRLDAKVRSPRLAAPNVYCHTLGPGS